MMVNTMSKKKLQSRNALKVQGVLKQATKFYFKLDLTYKINNKCESVGCIKKYFFFSDISQQRSLW